jgi:hypothetical protein
MWHVCHRLKEEVADSVFVRRLAYGVTGARPQVTTPYNHAHGCAYSPTSIPPGPTCWAIGLKEGEAAGVAQVVAAALRQQEVVVGPRQGLPGHQVQVGLGDCIWVCVWGGWGGGGGQGVKAKGGSNGVGGKALGRGMGVWDWDRRDRPMGRLWKWECGKCERQQHLACQQLVCGTHQMTEMSRHQQPGVAVLPVSGSDR